MQPTISQLTIPNPCNQQWHNMSPVDNGRYCASCKKVLTDFTRMTDAQIITYLTINQKACGRFTSTQLNTLNYNLQVQNTRKNSLFKQLILLAGLIALVPSKSKAQSRQSTEQGSVQQKGSGSAPEATTFITLKGMVIDSRNLEGMPGVTVMPENGTATVSDISGRFSIKVPSTTCHITFNFIGYKKEVMELHEGNLDLKDLKIQLVEEHAMLGEPVIIVKTPLHKRLYYRFIRRPWKRIFG